MATSAPDSPVAQEEAEAPGLPDDKPHVTIETEGGGGGERDKEGEAGGKGVAKEKRKVSLGLAKLKWRSRLRKEAKPAGLPYWQLIVVPRAILPFHFLFGFTFLAIGILITISVTEFRDVVLDYTMCDVSAGQNFSSMNIENDPWNAQWKFDNDTKTCSLKFTLEEDLEGPVQLYYQLTNYFQNSRRYIQSKNPDQLLGEALLDLSQLSACAPLVTPVNSTVIYYPCGLIANSMFNDTFSNLTDANGEVFALSEKGIAWEWEYAKVRNTKYESDPDGVYRTIMPPPEWTKYKGVYTTANIPKLGEDEHFIVWARISGGPDFRKLYSHSNDTLPAGTYTLDIVSEYEVKSFKGTKSVVIQHLTWLDGIGPNLGYSFLAVGVVMLVAGLVLVLANLLKPRKLGDASLLSWNRAG